MMPLRQHLGFQYVAAISADGNAFVLICYLYISQSLIVLVYYHHVLYGRRLEEVLQKLLHVVAILDDLDLLSYGLLYPVDVRALSAYGRAHISFLYDKDYAVVVLIYDAIPGHAARQALEQGDVSDSFGGELKLTHASTPRISRCSAIISESPGSMTAKAATEKGFPQADPRSLPIPW